MHEDDAPEADDVDEMDMTLKIKSFVREYTFSNSMKIITFRWTATWMFLDD